VLGHEPKLDDEAAGEVLRLGLAALFAPDAQQSFLVNMEEISIIT
jgi:hypothetical protein